MPLEGETSSVVPPFIKKGRKIQNAKCNYYHDILV